MKIKINILYGLLVLLLLVSNNALSILNIDKKNTIASSMAVKNSLRAHIEFLADDKLNGRNTGSVEYEIAAQYVASHFMQFGLKPAGDNNTFLQSVPFIKSTLGTASPKMILHHDDKNIEFEFPQQFVSLPSSVSTEDVVRGKLVFVGYGITSHKMKHDDYAGLDVKNKIVVMLAGRPTSFSNEEGAHLSNLHAKFNQAEIQGAKGVIMLHTSQEERLKPYQSVISFAKSPLLNWQRKSGGVFDSYSNLKTLSYVTINTGKTLFSATNYDLNTIFAEIEMGKVPVGFDMGIEVSFTRKSNHETIYSSNVIGVLEGSDPVLKNEYVVYSAHLDHLGNSGDGPDTIHNGALDNASGIAIILETAHRFSKGTKPKRSIIFVAVTGEEKGLLGSNYFVHNPPVPVSSMVANINLDMPLILYPLADIVAFGAQHSTMKNDVESAVKANGLKLIADPMPEQALFVRSDHYSFVKKGIPSIFLAPGFTSKDPKINSGQIFRQFFSKHYHKPSDDISLPINYEAGLTFTKVNFDIGNKIANSEKRPHWNKRSLFNPNK